MTYKDMSSNPAKQAYIKGLKQYKDGDLKNACRDFSYAIKVGIDDFDILYYRGMCFLDASDYTSANNDFEVLLRKNPDNPEYRYRRGFIRYKLGDQVGAIQDFTFIQEDYDDFSLRWHYLAVLYYKAGEIESAHTSIERALSKFPTMAKIWFNAGVILSTSGLTDRSELAFVTAFRLDERLSTVKREILD